jgi:hypothetical protein
VLSTKTQPVAFISPPFFSASWVGRDPHTNQLRLVHCFGPSQPDDFAPLHATVLGLEPLTHQGGRTRMSKVWAELDHDCLVLHVDSYDRQDCEVLRTEPLPTSLINVLHWCPEVLLFWVDTPLQNPQADLSHVGLEHVWTGIAPLLPAACSTVA